MTTASPTRRKSATMNKGYYCSSEDEDLWQEDDPVINCLAFGWLEDGRCGFQRQDGRVMQTCPQPIPTFSLKAPVKKRKSIAKEKWKPKYICKKVSAGSRHSLFLMIDCARDDEDDPRYKPKELDSDEEDDAYDDTIVIRKRRRPRKVLISGLNQVGLCEEKGLDEPVPLSWEESWDRPTDIAAGRGNSFIITKSGQVFACGHNRYGMLGLSHCDWVIHPQRIQGPLLRRVVLQVAAGGFHALCRTEDEEVYAWGRNHKGQLGIGSEEEAFVSQPQLVVFPPQSKKMKVLQVCAGLEHSIALLQKTIRTRRSQTWSSSVPLTGSLASNAASNANTANTRASFVLQQEQQALRASSSLSNQNNNSQLTLSSNSNDPSGHPPQRRKSMKSKTEEEDEEDDELFDIEITRFVYVWGGHERGQLGSGDKELRHRPQENFWLTKLTQSLQVRISQIAAGGYHNLALLEGSGQVISWGAGDRGQLGSGLQFDDHRPRIINQLERVTAMAAGLRHSAVAVDNGATSEVYVWGCNSWGQLGLGHCDVRLQPTKISGIRSSRVTQLSCGDRHTLLRLNHHPMRAKDIPALQPFFEVLNAHSVEAQNLDANNQDENRGKSLSRQQQQVQYRTMLRALQHQLKVQLPHLDPSLLEKPEGILQDQAGLNIQELRNDVYEKGLQYCLDTKYDEFDWRRKSLEACFEVFVPPGRHLRKVCLSCARNCLHMFRLRPYIRSRQKTDTCDCRMSGLCVSLWSPVRETFDLFSAETLADDGCLAPRNIRQLLKRLRAPFPVESADVEEALGTLADGVELVDLPRIGPVAFEQWYRRHYDEHGDDDPQQQIQRILAEEKKKLLAEQESQRELEERRREEEEQKEKKEKMRSRFKFGTSSSNNSVAGSASSTGSATKKQKAVKKEEKKPGSSGKH